MKILAFSDLHADFAVLKKLIKRAKEKDIELIICAGDFTIFGQHQSEILRQLNTVKKPIAIIPGNHEDTKSFRKEVKKHEHLIDIHERMWKFNEILFLGWGTDGFSKHNADFRAVARAWRHKLKPNDKSIIVTHAPPYKTKLDKLYDDNVGNADIRKEIERIQPLLAISGHIHETEGQEDKIKQTKLINPGWNGMVVEI